jgi:hypothetical protein
MNQKRRIHDGIVGAVITAGVALGYYVHPLWLLVPGLIGATLLLLPHRDSANASQSAAMRPAPRVWRPGAGQAT